MSEELDFSQSVSTRQPTNLLIMLLGTFVGIFVGAMPGLSSAVGLSLMLPLTLRVRRLQPVS